MVKTQALSRGKRTDPHYVAQDILSRRDNSTAEVEGKLRAKGFSPQQIDETITWLISRKLLNDEKFAARYVENTLAIKAVGPHWLTHKLKEKRIASHIIEKVVTAVFSDGQESELALRASAAWRRQHPTKAGNREALTRFLLARGFSYEVIKSAGAGSVPQRADV